MQNIIIKSGNYGKKNYIIKLGIYLIKSAKKKSEIANVFLSHFDLIF